ncbi:hypothetical protein DFH06DRAFT_90655 [Mycena polygramma]|nr:hypothetical protein DFH06DRAFT_90655 [Mycena polygramma]
MRLLHPRSGASLPALSYSHATDKTFSGPTCATRSCAAQATAVYLCRMSSLRLSPLFQIALHVHLLHSVRVSPLPLLLAPSLSFATDTAKQDGHAEPDCSIAHVERATDAPIVLSEDQVCSHASPSFLFNFLRRVILGWDVGRRMELDAMVEHTRAVRTGAADAVRAEGSFTV